MAKTASGSVVTSDQCMRRYDAILGTARRRKVDNDRFVLMEDHKSGRILMARIAHLRGIPPFRTDRPRSTDPEVPQSGDGV